MKGEAATLAIPAARLFQACETIARREEGRMQRSRVHVNNLLFFLLSPSSPGFVYFPFFLFFSPVSCERWMDECPFRPGS